MEAKSVQFVRLQQEESQGYDRKTIDYIHSAAQRGLYEIRGLGAKRGPSVNAARQLLERYAATRNFVTLDAWAPDGVTV